MIAFKEIDVLDERFRAKVIKEILGEENQIRKQKQYRRYEVYNDMVAKHTEDLFAKQFDQATIEEMRMSLTNVSLCKKIINKISRVYSHGVSRELVEKRKQKEFDKLEKRLKINSKMKKANRYLELHKNIWTMALPVANRNMTGDVESYDLKISVLPPFLFDVIESSENREEALALILSNYNPKNAQVRYDAPERTGARGSIRGNQNSFPEGDGKDQVIADNPLDFDPEKQSFIWWTKSFHFVTDQKGIMISEGEPLNPIDEIPGISLNKDQDDQFWSIGGDDLVDSCILANAMLTNINHIGIQQGYGQAFMIGKNLPDRVKLGPTHCVKLEPSGEGETASFGYANSGAPLTDLKDLTVTQIALLLSTNNLSTTGVKVDLGSGSEFPSGIAQMIDKSESTEDVKDQMQIFLDNEPRLWRVIGKWLDLYRSKGLLTEDLKNIEYNWDALSINIKEPQTIISESEKLDNLKKRKELGLNTMLELILIDNPGMNDTDAEKKLLELIEEKQKAILDAQAMMMKPDEESGVQSEKPEDLKPFDDGEDTEDLFIDENNQIWKKTANGFEKVNTQ